MAVSLAWHVPSPHVWHAPQSVGQVLHVSVPLHAKSPQLVPLLVVVLVLVEVLVEVDEPLSPPSDGAPPFEGAPPFDGAPPLPPASLAPLNTASSVPSAQPTRVKSPSKPIDVEYFMQHSAR